MVPKRWSACRLQKFWGKQCPGTPGPWSKKFSLGHGILGSHQNFEGHILIESQQGTFIRDVDDQFESSIDLVLLLCFATLGAETPPPFRRRNNSISQGHLFSCYILYMKKDSNSKFTSIYFLKQLKNATAHAWPSFLNFCCIRAIQSPGYPFAGQGMFWERW